jgi:2-dehydropantoate 2-reductase
MKTENEPLLIIGTGALASLFAGRFTKTGIPMKMLGGWTEGVKAIRDKGLRFIDTDGIENTYPVDVIDTLDDCQNISTALVLVKSWQTERTARKLADCMLPEGRVLTLQNGLGNQSVLERGFVEGRVFTGVTTTGATLLGPGRVRAGGEGIISLLEHPELKTFVSWFRRAGFLVETVSNIDTIVWGKLVINAAINPLTAILGIPNGELLNILPARNLMKTAALEVAAVARAIGVVLPNKDPVAAVEEVARNTAANRSSMLQDIQRNAPTEIDAISGAVVNIGNELGIPVPVNETLHQLVKAMVEVKNFR